MRHCHWNYFWSIVLFIEASPLFFPFEDFSVSHQSAMVAHSHPVFTYLSSHFFPASVQIAEAGGTNSWKLWWALFSPLGRLFIQRAEVSHLLAFSPVPHKALQFPCIVKAVDLLFQPSWPHCRLSAPINSNALFSLSLLSLSAFLPLHASCNKTSAKARKQGCLAAQDNYPAVLLWLYSNYLPAINFSVTTTPWVRPCRRRIKSTKKRGIECHKDETAAET